MGMFFGNINARDLLRDLGDSVKRYSIAALIRFWKWNLVNAAFKQFKFHVFSVMKNAVLIMYKREISFWYCQLV